MKPAEQAPPAPEAAPERLTIGREIRRWRKVRGLVLAQVAKRAGLNISYLSQIEREKALPSLDAFMSIARALEVPPAWLLLYSAPPPRVIRRADRPRLKGEGAHEVTEVDGGSAPDLRIIEAVVAPGEQVGRHAHTGHEHHLVLSGRFRLTHGDQVYDLEPGDYLSWDPTIAHAVTSLGPEPGRMLIIYSRSGLDTGPLLAPFRWPSSDLP